MSSLRDLKYRARRNLSNGKYGICLIAVLICNMVSLVFTRFSVITPEMGTISTISGAQQFVEAVSQNMFLFLGIIFSILTVTFAVSIFVNNPLNVALVRFFNEAARGNADLKELFFPFKNGFSGYLNIVKIQFFKALLLILWALVGVVPVCALMIFLAGMIRTENALAAYIIVSYLLIIVGLVPMIIKSYQYMMVDYILTDEPGISRKEVFLKSKQMAHGNIFFMFKLNLSFIGWILLGALACGVGSVVVMPYINMAFSELYLELKGEETENLEGETGV